MELDGNYTLRSDDFQGPSALSWDAPKASGPFPGTIFVAAAPTTSAMCITTPPPVDMYSTGLWDAAGHKTWQHIPPTVIVLLVPQDLASVPVAATFASITPFQSLTEPSLTTIPVSVCSEHNNSLDAYDYFQGSMPNHSSTSPPAAPNDFAPDYAHLCLVDGCFKSFKKRSQLQ
jgi:hypothetical protein